MIVLERVSKTYDTGHFAVSEVSLRVPAGQMLVLLGGSGCGKTTTLKMINRLVELTSGRIEVDGQDVRSVDPVQLRRGIGYVLQGSGLFSHMTVAENIAVVPRLLNWPAERIERCSRPKPPDRSAEDEPRFAHSLLACHERSTPRVPPWISGTPSSRQQQQPAPVVGHDPLSPTPNRRLVVHTGTEIPTRSRLRLRLARAASR